MKSKEIIEVVAYDLSNNECTALLIRNSINSLERALTTLYREDLDSMMQELGIEGAK